MLSTGFGAYSYSRFSGGGMPTTRGAMSLSSNFSNYDLKLGIKEVMVKVP